MLQHDIHQHLPFHLTKACVQSAQMSLAKLNQCQVWYVNGLSIGVKACNTHAKERLTTRAEDIYHFFGAMPQLDKLSCTVPSL